MGSIGSSLEMPRTRFIVLCASVLGLSGQGLGWAGETRLVLQPGATSTPVQLRSDFLSFSIEPAYWVEFFGTASEPNSFSLRLLEYIANRTGTPPIIRPGGITMDSMTFEPNGTDPTRVTSPSGGVYETIYGPAWFKSFDNFPNGTRFVGTLDFWNNSLEIATNEALAWAQYVSPEKIFVFELGNEPTNYARWTQDSPLGTLEYVDEWTNWTKAIDNELPAGRVPPEPRWWGSSATTDTGPGTTDVLPAAIIPLGIDNSSNILEYSIHSYAWSTCDPTRNALATIPNLLNHSSIVAYANTFMKPSEAAALASGSGICIGEFNSVSCSGKPNVTDTFTQALWTVDTSLNYAAINASHVFLHQGATLVFQSSSQSNTAGSDGTPGWSAYDLWYPVNSTLRGPQRVNPGYVSQLLMAEAIGDRGNSHLATLATPQGISNDSFSAYAIYDSSATSSPKDPARLVILNMSPYLLNMTSPAPRQHVTIDISAFAGAHGATLKRMTAPSADELNSTLVTWAGQSWGTGEPQGDVHVEDVHGGQVVIQQSEAVLIFLSRDPS